MKKKILVLLGSAFVLALALPSWAQDNLNMKELSKELKKGAKYSSTSNFIQNIKEGNVEAKDLEIIISIERNGHALFNTVLENLTKADIINNFPAEILFNDERDMTYQTAAIIEKIGGNPDELTVHYEIKTELKGGTLVDGSTEYILEREGTLLDYWAHVLPNSDNENILGVAKVLLDNNATITDKIHLMINVYGSEKSKELLKSAEDARTAKTK